MQGQLDAGRAIQEHAPELITVSWLTTRSTGAELATRAIRSKQLVDEINMLKRARDDELWQVRASVILDDKGDGRVVEQAARHDIWSPQTGRHVKEAEKIWETICLRQGAISRRLNLEAGCKSGDRQNDSQAALTMSKPGVTGKL